MDITPEVDISDYDQQGCLHEMFIRQANRTPDDVAIVTDKNEQITFGELNGMSDVLASLLQKDGVTSNTVVGILMERSPEYVVSVIGIHKAGGAYLPLEVSYPQELLDSVIEDSKPLVVCTKKDFLNRFRNSKDILKNVYEMDNWKEVYLMYKSKIQTFIPVQVNLDDMAYTVYSSGTTGKPKGIQCPHRGAVFSYTWRHRAYPYESGAREACNVFFVWEMLRPLLKGIPLYIIPDDVIYDPPCLAEFIRKYQITRMLFTPSLMQAVLEFQGLDLKTDFSSFKEIWFCGEVVTTALRNRVADLLPGIRLLNVYSISESHDIANSDISKPACGEARKFCPVGKIFPQVHIVVMDDDKNVKNIGEPGEIYIGGPTLAIGYLNKPDLNAERFIERPEHVDHKVGPRLYKTGDWGFILADGSLEICGRCDSAVRIRGYNVELQMVEKMLLDLPEVSACCILAHGQEDDEKYLVGFIVLDLEFFKVAENSLEIPEKRLSFTRSIRMKLKNRLPIYMIPSKFVFLEKIPILEASGKLDKKALITELSDENSYGNETKIDYQGQTLTDTQLKVANKWARLLHLYVIDIHENFFDLGGHSLAASRLVSELNDEFGSTLNVRAVFQHPTIHELSCVIDGIKSDIKFNLPNELKSHSDFIPYYPDLDKRLAAFWKSIKINDKKLLKGNVLLTGATGFVGSHLLHEILLKTQSTVYCIVRDSPDVTPIERIINAQKSFGLPSREDLLNERVVPLKGDVSLLNFGLPEEVYITLCFDIDIIIHASANVNLILPYHALLKDNVTATKNIILFAVTNKIKFVNYISSNAVFPEGCRNCKEDDDMHSYVDKLNHSSGYAQTKWLSEQLVLQAAKVGLPTVIFRCGNVAGGINRPCWNPSDFILFMIQGVLVTKTAPDIDWKIELTPIEFVREVIVKLSFDISSSAGKVFHVINNKLLHCRELWAKMKELGYEVNVENYEEWLIEVSAHQNLQVHFHLLQNMAKNEDYFSNISEFKKYLLDNYLKKYELNYPEVTLDLFTVYLRNLADLNLIPCTQEPKFNVTKNSILKPVLGVADKVVLVTGGSSGIGAGISIELGLSGAKVAMLARGIDRLNKIKSYLESKGVKNIFIKSVDIMDSDQVSQAVKDIESKLGTVDILVNNAGCMYYQLMENCNLSEWHHMVKLNCIGSLNCLSSVLKSMVKRKSGHIITITSDAGRKAFPGLAVYSGTKFFLEGVCSALRMELSSFNIKVTCIQPGDVHSELRQLTTDLEAAEKYDFSKSIKILQPLDIGKSVVYVLSQPDYCAINEILIEPQQAPI